MEQEKPQPGTEGNSGNEFFIRVYDELHRLASAKLARERRGHSLQPTALVNETFLKLQEAPDASKWRDRRHFFTAAAEAMRRILVDNARRKKIRNRDLVVRATESGTSAPALDDVLDVHEGLDELSQQNAEAAELVKLHYFAGLTIEESAELLGLNRRTAFRHWSFARAWLFRRLNAERAAKKK